MYIYVKPMYNIEFYIILKTYIHMQGPSFNPNPIPNPKNLKKENPNLNPRNQRRH